MDRVRVSQFAFLTGAWGIVVAVLAQVSLIGLWMFSGQPTLSLHREFGHLITLAAGALVALAFLGRLPRSLKLTTALMFAILVVQTEVFAFIPGSPLRAFHTVLPFVIFGLAAYIALAARPFIAGRPAPSPIPRYTELFPATESLGSDQR